jgi:hypothetical protein
MARPPAAAAALITSQRRRGSMSDQSTMIIGCLIPVSKVLAIAR